MLLRLVYLAITNAFTLLRLLPGSDQDNAAEILALRHKLAVLHRQLDGQRVRSQPADRAGHATAPPAEAHFTQPAAADTTRHDPALAP